MKKHKLSDQQFLEMWQLYCDSGKKPDNIPDRPDVVYKDEGWVSWSQWFKDIGLQDIE